MAKAKAKTKPAPKTKPKAAPKPAAKTKHIPSAAAAKLAARWTENAADLNRAAAIVREECGGIKSDTETRLRALAKMLVKRAKKKRGE